MGRLPDSLVVCILLFLFASHVFAQDARQRTNLDRGWRFALGNGADPAKDFGFGSGFFFNAKAGYGDGAAAGDFDDRGWRVVDLPHDWAVELPFDSKSDNAHGSKPLGHAYPATSVGWYRKPLDIPVTDLGRRIRVDFDGAFRDAQVYSNGHSVGRFPSGYDGFSCDLTDTLNYGGKNELAVRLDATLKEGWFYEGAGIYRHVWLVKTDPLHVAVDGTFVTADVVAADGASADLTARVTVANDSPGSASFSIRHVITDPGGATVADLTVPGLALDPWDSREFPVKTKVVGPRLWSPESPVMYSMSTTVLRDGKPVDLYQTPFGIRTLRFDKDQGFFLNGKHVLIKGTCCHQDHAGVGVAVPDAVQEFRVRTLQSYGCNGIRTSHNPPTPELLDVCDRLGMLVLDENRQTGVGPAEMAGFAKLIRRDRNHPCVFLWSAGNEEWGIEGNTTGVRVVEAQRQLAHKLDPSRLMTTAISGGWGKGSSESVDVMGFNYFVHGDVDKYHAQHPDQPCIGTEEASCMTTRGIYADDKPNGHLTAYGDFAPSWAASAEKWVNFYDKRPFVAGAFIWTGIDYRGEPKPTGWPAINSQYGAVDTCGFPKDSYYFYQSCWTDKPMVHVLPHWNWPGKQGQVIDVRTYSTGDEIELSLNGKSLGRQTVVRLSQLRWKVPYEPGKLVATAYKNGQVIATDAVETSGETATFKLTPDRAVIHADGQDVSLVTVQAVDGQGRPVPTADNLVHFSITGPGKIIGVGNGDPSCHEPDVFVEHIRHITIGPWRSRPVGDSPPAVAEDVDESAWDADNKDVAFDADLPREMLVFRAHVDMAFETGEKLAMFLSKGGSEPKVYVNGKPLNDPADATTAFHPGKNTVAVVTMRPKKWSNFGASISITTPPSPWQRSVFGGLAQVLVRSTGVGEIELSAAAETARPGNVSITAK